MINQAKFKILITKNSKSILLFHVSVGVGVISFLFYLCVSVGVCYVLIHVQVLLFPAMYTTMAGLEAPGISPVSTSHHTGIASTQAFLWVLRI